LPTVFLIPHVIIFRNGLSYSRAFSRKLECTLQVKHLTLSGEIAPESRFKYFPHLMTLSFISSPGNRGLPLWGSIMVPVPDGNVMGAGFSTCGSVVCLPLHRRGPLAPASIAAPGERSAGPVVTASSVPAAIGCFLLLVAQMAIGSLILHKVSDRGSRVGTPGPENQERGLWEQHVAAQNQARFAQ